MIIEVYQESLKNLLQQNGYTILQQKKSINGATVWTMTSNGCSFNIGENFAGQYRICDNLRLTF